MAECVVHWFRRDLRLQDNLALEAALRTGVSVIPVFILDARILARPTMGELRLQFLRTALDDLDGRLRERGSGLVVVHAEDAARALNHLTEEAGAWALFFNRDYTPYARWRDTRATRGMQMTGVVTMPSDDLLLVPPLQTLGEDEVLPTDFEAFRSRWFAGLDVAPEPTPDPGGRFMPTADLPAGAAAWREMLAPDRPGPATWPGATPAAAGAQLRRFVDAGLAGYATRRDEIADADATSRLSAALKFGTISVRRVAAAVVARGARDVEVQPSVEAFIDGLAWREFAHHLLFNRPELLTEPLHGATRSAAFSPVPGGLEAWMSARTGIPLVDAGMRQLHAEGWIPDRVRVVTAAFLADRLGGDWRAGERHFARHLVDLDLAVNDMGWQRAAGVGVQPAPGGGAANPLSVAADRDPDGAYVRRFLPELARVPDAYLHQPWAMPDSLQAETGCRLGIDYPSPVAPADPPRGH